MRLPHSLSLSAITFALLCAPAASVHGQASTATRDSARQHEPLFTSQDAKLGAAFAAVTVAMFPIDKSVARRFTRQRSRGSNFLDKSTSGVEFIADPGALVIGATLYAFGRFANHPDIEDLGWHGTEAVLVGSAVTGAIKVLAGRSRPYVTGDNNPRDFKFIGGLSDSGRTSFPSGHTTAAFAAAASVTSEAKRIWPGHTWLVGGAMYGGATLVGLSRMYHDKHWASDVALAAGIGTFSGLKVVKYAHTHPGNRLDNAVLGLSAAPGPHGTTAMLNVSVQY